MPQEWSGSVRRLAHWALIASLACYALSVVFRWADPRSHLALDLVLFNATYALAGIACWLRPQGADRRGWQCLAIACWIVGCGNIVFSLTLRGNPEVTPPTWADVLFLAWYPLLYAALILLLKPRVRRFLPSMWLDGLVAGLGTASATIALVVGPATDRQRDGIAQLLMNLSYPAADAVLLIVLAAT
ncbi:MAG: hypothetical protein ACRC0L_08310, partial [Angustibacter sp.]